MQGIAWVFRKQHAPTPTTQPPGAYVRNKTHSHLTARLIPLLRLQVTQVL